MNILVSFMIWFSQRFRDRMVLFGSWLDLVGGAVCADLPRSWIHELGSLLTDGRHGPSLCLQSRQSDGPWRPSEKIPDPEKNSEKFLKDSRSGIFRGSFWWRCADLLTLKRSARAAFHLSSSPKSTDSMVGPDRAVLDPWFPPTLPSVTILDTIACSGHCFGCSLRPGAPWNSPWESASPVDS